MLLAGARGIVEPVSVAGPTREPAPGVPIATVAPLWAAVVALVEDLGAALDDPAVTRDDLGPFVGVLAEELIDTVDGGRDRTLGGREGDPALVLTLDAAVFVVGTGTPPLAAVDAVRSAVLANDGEHVPALREDAHTLRKRALGSWIDTFVTVGVVGRHGFSLPRQPGPVSLPPGVQHAPRGRCVSTILYEPHGNRCFHYGLPCWLTQTDNYPGDVGRCMPREHGDSGEYVETVTLDDVLDTFDHVEGPVVLSADVADRLGCSRETARRKLEALHDRGDLARRKVSRRVIYWRPESGRESAVTPSPAPPDRSGVAPTDGQEDAPDAVDAAAAAEGWDGAGLDARKEAGRAVLAYLRKHGSVSQQEAKEEIHPEHPVGGQSPDTWYRKTIRPVLNEAPEVEYDSSERAYTLTEGGTNT